MSCTREWSAGMLPRMRLTWGWGKRDDTAAGETMAMGQLRGNVFSIDAAARTTFWRTVTDEATVEKRITGRRFRRSHG